MGVGGWGQGFFFSLVISHVALLRHHARPASWRVAGGPSRRGAARGSAALKNHKDANARLRRLSLSHFHMLFRGMLHFRDKTPQIKQHPN